jgi:alkylation response protein AidB-like acyl-CoA dehydrogenase
VNLLLSSDQEALRDGIRSLCTGRFAMDRVRAGFDAEVWKELAAAGVFTTRQLDLGVADAVVVFEELGRALVPGPLVWGWLNDRDDVIATGIERHDPTAEHFALAGTLLVIDEDGLWEINPSAVTAEERPEQLDPLTPVHRLDNVPQGERRGDPMWLEAATVTAAQLVGIAAACTDAAVAYAKERQQFDKPIGSFQAVKHICADMFVRTDTARAAVYAAAAAIDDRGATDERRAVASAKLLAGQAAIANARSSLQVHGGMGFTWEVDVHLYLKRAWLLDKVFGGTAEHADAIARKL